MKIMFIRLNIEKSSQSFLDQFWDDKVIAMDWTDDQYRTDKNAHQALRRLKECEDEKVLIAADYPSKTGLLRIGRIEHGAKVIRNDPRYSAPDKTFQFTTLQLSKEKNGVVDVSLTKYPVLSIQPRRGTICQWGMKEEIIQAAFNETALPCDVESLHYSQLEVLCYEYLRDKKFLGRLLMPIGRTLPDFDICGISPDGLTLFAQVTHVDTIKETAIKIRKLLPYASNDCVLFYFGPESIRNVVAGIAGDIKVEFIATQDVFIKYESSDFIKRMLNPLGK